jgi:Na+/proline symporter
MPSEGAYIAIVLQNSPAGLIGLFATGMISATLATMDDSLCSSAGIVTRSIYLPLLRPKASEGELVCVGRVATVVLGVVTILIALMYTTWQDIGVFKLMQNFSALLGVPVAIPMVWSLFFRRGPDWAAWSTVLVNLLTVAAGTALLSMPLVISTIERAGGAAYIELFKSHDYVFFVFFNVVTASLWYVAVSLLWHDQTTAPRRSQIAEFFRRFDTPLTEKEVENQRTDPVQTAGIGRLVMLFAGCSSLLLLIPNRLTDRFAIGFCVGFVWLIGVVLYWQGRRSRSQSPEDSLPRGESLRPFRTFK